MIQAQVISTISGLFTNQPIFEHQQVGVERWIWREMCGSGWQTGMASTPPSARRIRVGHPREQGVQCVEMQQMVRGR